MGSDSNSYWRYDIKSIIKLIIALAILRAISIFAGFDSHLPVIDDILGPVFKILNDFFRAIQNFLILKFG